MDFSNFDQTQIIYLGLGAIILAAAMKINSYFQKKKAKKTDDTEKVEKKFFLRTVSDWWTPILYSIVFVILSTVLIELPLTLDAIASYQGLLFRLLVLSFAVPTARLLMEIFFTVLDGYSEEKRKVDWNNLAPNQRIWVYVTVLLSLVWAVVH